MAPNIGCVFLLGSATLSFLHRGTGPLKFPGRKPNVASAQLGVEGTLGRWCQMSVIRSMVVGLEDQSLGFYRMCFNCSGFCRVATGWAWCSL